MTNTNTNTQELTGIKAIYAEELKTKTLDQLHEEKTRWKEQIEKEGYGGSKIARDMLNIVTVTIMNR